MGVVVTPLGFRKPDGDEPIRNGDNEISHNAQVAQDQLAMLRGQVANLSPGGDPAAVQDAIVAGLLADAGTQSSLSVTQRVAESMGGYALRPKNGRRAVGQGELVTSAADYGLVGDGVTNDTAALGSAIAATPAGGTLTIPDTAVCRITDPATIDKAMRITGGTIKAPTGIAALRVTASDVTIERVAIVGPGTAGGYNNQSFGVLTVGTAAQKLRNVTVRDCTFTGVDGDAIRYQWTNDSLIEGNTIRDTSYCGVMLLSVDTVTVSANLVDGLVQKLPAVNSYGIAVTDLENTLAARSRRVLILGNTVKNVPAWEGIDTHGADQVSVIGNFIYGCGAAIAFVVGNETRVTVPERGIIANNVIERGPATAGFAAIRLIGKASAKASGNITGNYIINYATPYEVSNIDDSLCAFSGNLPSLGDTVEDGSYVQSGTINASGGNTATTNVVFTKKFRTVPEINVNPVNGRIRSVIKNRTTTGFTVELQNWTPANTSNVTVEWRATE